MNLTSNNLSSHSFWKIVSLGSIWLHYKHKMHFFLVQTLINKPHFPFSNKYLTLSIINIFDAVISWGIFKVKKAENSTHSNVQILIISPLKFQLINAKTDLNTTSSGYDGLKILRIYFKSMDLI